MLTIFIILVILYFAFSLLIEGLVGVIAMVIGVLFLIGIVGRYMIDYKANKDMEDKGTDVYVDGEKTRVYKREEVIKMMKEAGEIKPDDYDKNDKPWKRSLCRYDR